MSIESQAPSECYVYQYESKEYIEDEYLSIINGILSDRYLDNPDMKYLVALDDHDEFLGVVAYKVIDGISTLCEIFVEEAKEGRGVGSELMRQFDAETGDTTKQLTVLSNNDRAIALYRRHGYEILNWPSGNLEMEKSVDEGVSLT